MVKKWKTVESKYISKTTRLSKTSDANKVYSLWAFPQVLVAYLYLQVVCCQGTQLENFIFTENYDFENAFINQTFWPRHDVLAELNDDYYVIEVQTNWNNGKIEYDGRIVRWDNTCTIIHQKSVRCITETGPAELYRKINKSHIETEWTWTWKDLESKNLKRSQKKFKLKNVFMEETEPSQLAGLLLVIALVTTYAAVHLFIFSLKWLGSRKQADCVVTALLKVKSEQTPKNECGDLEESQHVSVKKFDDSAYEAKTNMDTRDFSEVLKGYFNCSLHEPRHKVPVQQTIELTAPSLYDTAHIWNTAKADYEPVVYERCSNSALGATPRRRLSCKNESANQSFGLSSHLSTPIHV